MTNSNHQDDTPRVDDHTGTETTGHSWDGIEELNTPLPRWWLIVFYGTIVWALIYCIFMPSFPGLPGLRNHSERANVQQQMEQVAVDRTALASQLLSDVSLEEIEQDPELFQFVMAAGKSAFGDNCATCHGIGGRGVPGYPSLADDVWLWGGTLEDIRHTITHGIRAHSDETRFSMMPSYGIDGLLSPEEIDDLAVFVSNFSSPHSNQAAIDRAAPVFEAQCSTCHGTNGQGDRSMGAPNLTDAEWLYGSDVKTIRSQIRNGRNGVMPNWGERLDETTIVALSVYVHALGGGEATTVAEAEPRDEHADAGSLAAEDNGAEQGGK